MKTKEDIVNEVKANYDQMKAQNTITPTAYDRSFNLFDQITKMLQEYAGKLADPRLGEAYAAEFEQKFIFLVGKELDYNFYEGMAHLVGKNLKSLASLPGIDKMMNDMKISMVKMDANGKSLEEKDLKKLFETVETPRGKKEDLN